MRGCRAICKPPRKININASTGDLDENMYRVNVTIRRIALKIPVIPIKEILLDLSAISASKGCRITAKMLEEANITPISELEYPLASRNTEAKLMMTP